jgi:hypothetical protein
MYPGPLDIAAFSLFGLAVGIVFVVLAWGAIRLLFIQLGYQSDTLLKDLFCIFILGIFSYIFYFFALISLPNINQIFNLPKSTLIGNYFLVGILPTAWVFWASIILGKSIRTSEGRGIGKIRAGAMFVTTSFFVLSALSSIEYFSKN